ncbi:RluA family pseudouridine synthase [Pseudotabrizicola algicola]|uniref:Pseudouridine synthase n=1 Tax=Pseudotabrizicola algicola TaxID=2709381 RepID=A0A6B3RRF7_9RHOB|nr:RluA family pseudouridine synthase [Pseudotabrizicola algicola]NEX47388.1 RluA family pseudouridine synthase [Pseudotabrizicola algicola]
MSGPLAEAFDDEDPTLVVTIAEGCADRLDKALARSVPEDAALSRTRLMKMIADGAVWRAGVALTDPKIKVEEGEVITLMLDPPARVDTLAEDIPLVVVYEDDHLIVVDKPVGMVVHPAPGTPSGTLVNALLAHCGDTLSGIGGERRPGIVHRIDKDTSGLLVVAKSDKAHHGLAAQFERHDVNRRYVALVHAVPNAADPRLRGIKGVSFETGGIIKIATLLARHKTDRQRQAVVWHDGRHAVTRVRVLEAFADQAALVECWLETGRTHQIRVHMAHAGHGLLGDQTYGGKRKISPKALTPQAAEMGNSFPRQALHAATLGLRHPVTDEWLEFTSPLPEDMAALLEALRRPQE